MQFGHFDDQQREYVITDPRTPLPWINYLGSEDFFTLLSNTAGGYCFYRDARLRRLTRYRYNNCPVDQEGFHIYIKDGKTVWNPGWQPTKTELDRYTCRHGLGYSVIEGQKNGVSAAQTLLVPQGENCLLIRLCLKKTGRTVYVPLVKQTGAALQDYILKNFETWTGMAQPLEKTEQLYSQAVTLIGGTTATYGGDGITGVVSAERDGYLITSIPYDENFVLKVDGKETLLFRANTAFLGAKIPSGEHKIVLVYHAPGRTAGSWCSLMGGMLALILVICEKKKQQNGSERAGESKMLQKQRKTDALRDFSTVFACTDNQRHPDNHWIGPTLHQSAAACSAWPNGSPRHV